MTEPVHELGLDQIEHDLDAAPGSALMDAIDAASDQGRTTWLTDAAGKRIAKIAPVDEIPDELLSGRDPADAVRDRMAAKQRAIGELVDNPFDRAVSQHEEIVAGFDRAYPKLREWRERVAAGTARLAPDRRDDRTLLLGIEARLNTIGQRIGSSARYGEPGIIAQLARMETLQMVMARQVEEIHRTLGLERDEEGHLIADLLGPPFYGKQAEAGFARHEHQSRHDPFTYRVPGCGLCASWRHLSEAAGSSGRPEDRPDRICISCGQPEGEPHLPTCITRTGTLRETSSGRPGRPEPLLRPDGPLTPDMLRDALSLTDARPSLEEIQSWVDPQRSLAYDWAMRTHLAASDNEVFVPGRPSFIPGPESGS